jgi:hypothetical protein
MDAIRDERHAGSARAAAAPPETQTLTGEPARGGNVGGR